MSATPTLRAHGSSSALSTLEFGVQVLQSRSGVVDLELPIDAALPLVAVLRPRGRLAPERGDGSEPAVAEALAGERNQLGLGHRQPAPLLGRVPEVQAPDPLPRLRRPGRLPARP